MSMPDHIDELCRSRMSSVLKGNSSAENNHCSYFEQRCSYEKMTFMSLNQQSTEWNTIQFKLTLNPLRYTNIIHHFSNNIMTSTVHIHTILQN